MSWKTYGTMALVALITLAVVFRVTALRNVIVGAPASGG